MSIAANRARIDGAFQGRPYDRQTTWAAFGETFVTLPVISDPLGNAPVFLAVTHRLDPAERQRAAIRAVIAAGTLILGFAIFGELVLRYLDVSARACPSRRPAAPARGARDAARRRLPDRRLRGRGARDPGVAARRRVRGRSRRRSWFGASIHTRAATRP
jgi:hypothetical protein